MEQKEEKKKKKKGLGFDFWYDETAVPMGNTDSEEGNK